MDFFLGIVAGAAVITLILIMWIVGNLFRRVGPNRALIVYGWGGTHIVTGGGKVVWPLFQSFQELSLELMSFDVAPEQQLYTSQGVAVNVEAVAQIKVKSDPESIRTSAEQFLTKDPEERQGLIRLVMEGHLRGIVGLLKVEEIVKEPEIVAGRVRDSVADDLTKMGLEVVSFTIKKVIDESDYIHSMGRPDIARIKREADIAQAEAERDTAIRRAMAIREAAIAQAQADQERVIAQTASEAKQAEATRDLEVKRAEYEAAVRQQRAIAEKAYDIAANQAQQKVIAEQVRIEQIQRQEQIKVQEMEVQRRERELEATVTKQAQAERGRIELLAEAQRQKLAIEAAGQADAIRLQGTAEAEIVRAKGQAEADAMHLRAEAYQEYNQAAVLDKLISGMPEVVRALSQSLASVDKITVVSTGDGRSAGVSQITGEVAKMVAQVPELFETLTGMKMGELMDRLQGMQTPPSPQRPAMRGRDNGAPRESPPETTLKPRVAVTAEVAPPTAEGPASRLTLGGFASVVPIGALLILSGTAGLIYQVAWVRLLGLAFGVTVFAISTVLAAFMGGLAIGSVVGGRRADRVRRPLLIYGVVELAIGLTAILTPTIFGWLQGLYAGVAQVVDPTQAPLVAGTIRAVLVFAILLVPTALMGATLPLAVRGVRGLRNDDRARGDALAMGLLYALNTTGAILGCLLAGFVLIGRLGLSETIAVAAACNVAAGLGAILLSLRVARSRGSDATGSVPFGRHDVDRGVARAAFWVLAISGGISLAYEVVWSRTLAILFDSSIYGFVLMLATVLFGIAVGGALGGGLVGWRPSARLSGLTLGWLEIGIGLMAVLALVAFGSAYDLLTALRDSGPTLFARLLRTETRVMAALCITTVLPAALLMGATFPIGARLWAAGEDRLGRRLGGVYAANVSGAIVGSLAAGFLLVPLLGAHSSLMLLAVLSVATGCGLLLVVGAPRMAITGTVVALAAIGWGATRPQLHETVFRERFPDMQLLAYWEGLENTVSVAREQDNVLRLFTNARSQTNDSPDLVRYHRVMGHLAALLSPRQGSRTLVVGLGGGATPGALAQHSGAQIDLIELSEAVVAAAPYFAVANARVLERPNVRLSIDDGRNFLLRNRLAYDVITADVVPPFDAGATNLYSVEYFTLASRALAPDGIMVQWASPGSAFEHELIVRSFLQVFPHATLWLSGDLLVGSLTPQRISRAELDRRLADPAARAALAEVGLNRSQDVLAQFRGNTEDLRAYVGPGQVLTDNRPLLEYFLSLPEGELGSPPDLSSFNGKTPPLVD